MNACDECGQGNASIEYTEVAGGEISKRHLCENCAISEGLFSVTEESTGVDALLSNLASGEAPQVRPAPTAVGQCPTCEQSWEGFEETGLLGCEDCYKTFAMQLTRMLREGHDAPLHAGPGRRRASDPSALLPELQSLLEQAVREEDYEKAAELRDRIQQVERRAGESPSGDDSGGRDDEPGSPG